MLPEKVSRRAFGIDRRYLLSPEWALESKDDFDSELNFTCGGGGPG